MEGIKVVEHDVPKQNKNFSQSKYKKKNDEFLLTNPSSLISHWTCPLSLIRKTKDKPRLKFQDQFYLSFEPRSHQNQSQKKY